LATGFVGPVTRRAYRLSLDRSWQPSWPPRYVALRRADGQPRRVCHRGEPRRRRRAGPPPGVWASVTWHARGRRLAHDPRPHQLEAVADISEPALRYTRRRDDRRDDTPNWRASLSLLAPPIPASLSILYVLAARSPTSRRPAPLILDEIRITRRRAPPPLRHAVDLVLAQPDVLAVGRDRHRPRRDFLNPCSTAGRRHQRARAPRTPSTSAMGGGVRLLPDPPRRQPPLVPRSRANATFETPTSPGRRSIARDVPATSAALALCCRRSTSSRRGRFAPRPRRCHDHGRLPRRPSASARWRFDGELPALVRPRAHGSRTFCALIVCRARADFHPIQYLGTMSPVRYDRR